MTRRFSGLLIDLPPPGWVGRLVRARSTVLILLVFGLFLVACAGTSATGQLNADPANADPANVPVSQELPAAFIDADASAIVAAHEQVLVGIYERLLPSVVEIRTSRRLGLPEELPSFPSIPGFPEDRFPFERSGGSGFVWDDQGHIVTNHHVVDGADRLTVIFSDGTERQAEVLGTDPDSDLAVLKLLDRDGLTMPPAPLGDSGAVKPGQLAVAIGSPFGQEFTITSGIVSAVGRTIRSGNSQFSIPEVIQTDAPINPGNSGGPLLDRNGHVIGVNTQIISRSGSNSGIGFAVPINTAKRVIPELIENGQYQYAWLGISGTSLRPDVAELMDLPRDTRGTLVIDVTRNGPAEAAGLLGSDRSEQVEGLDLRLGGDIIVAIDGTQVRTIDDLIAYLVDNTRPEDESVLEVIREDGSRETIQVTLDRRPSP
ncbi:MAG: trypsin-like peptidase domain-containing protein [Chloroflexi bacterium]|nr:trypsin-like peptidase domain-containing protein [Chloroflexota bacterium]